MRNAREKNWMLPTGVDDVLGPQAYLMENLRNRILREMFSWGYQFTIPPMLEYLDSLLDGVGPDLELQTFAVTDQSSGRLLGIPADITPQIARIDRLNKAQDELRRYCYAGSVMHSVSNVMGGSRNPLQIGAELYGHDGVESDIEIILLLVKTLKVAGIADLTLELSDMGIFRELCKIGELDKDLENDVLKLLLTKNRDDLKKLLDFSSVGEQNQSFILSLLDLNGGEETIETAKATLSNVSSSIANALDKLNLVVKYLKNRCKNLNIHIDFAELQGYRYHSSITFSVYIPHFGRAIAWGGRYNSLYDGKGTFATGFSTDLKTLVELSSASESESSCGVSIYAPAGNEPELINLIEKLRTEGNIVVQGFSDTESKELGQYSEIVVKSKGKWTRTHLKN